MSNFRTRILGLATVATAFAGMSFGQVVTCATTGQTNPTLRAEGQTELLATLVVTCTNTVATATTGTVYITTSLPITSKAYGLPSANEATLIIPGTTTVPLAASALVTPPNTVTLGNGTAVAGTVSGNQVSFALPAGAVPASGAVTFYVTNIRVNASAGSTPQVTESGVLTYNTTGPGAALTTANSAIPGSASGGPGYILKTLGAPTLVPLGTATYTTCVGNPGTLAIAGTSFTLNITELVGGAFLVNGPPTGGEQGQYVSGGAGTAASADIITVTLANVPASATIWVPPAVSMGAAPATTTLTIANATLGTGFYAGLVGYTPTSGTVTIPYTVTASAAVGAQVFPVPVIMQFAANSAAAQGPVTVNYSYGPSGAALTGPASSVPTFVASSFTAANGSTITNCQTSLLFPFVTNQLGFDTGVVLSNTSTDVLGFLGKSSVSPQAGTCVLSFFGTGAPSPATGVLDPMGNSPSGQTHAFTVSSVAPGFQGYMIATCPFQYAHGLAYITYSLTQNNGVAIGYLAEVLTTRGASVDTVTF
jgi:hypothetical protein